MRAFQANGLDSYQPSGLSRRSGAKADNALGKAPQPISRSAEGATQSTVPLELMYSGVGVPSAESLFFVV